MPAAPPAATAEPDNVVQFKHLPRAGAPEEPADIPMPSIIARGQAAVAARLEAVDRHDERAVAPRRVVALGVVAALRHAVYEVHGARGASKRACICRI